MRRPRTGRRYGSRPSPGYTVPSWKPLPVRTIGEPARSLDRPASRHAIRRSFHVLNALDQLGVLFAVVLPHRLDRFLERLLVVDLDDLDARFFHVALRLLLHRVPKLALLLLRFFGKFGDQRLVVLRERVPGF